MDNPEKLTTQGTEEEDQQNKNVGHHYTHVKYSKLCH
jgi:hypothetical protein